MAGGYWHTINENDRLLSVGLTGMLWRFSEHAGEYTSGHGGHYSPDNYQSLAVPLTYGQRTTRYSYTVRGALFYSKSQTKDAPFYPTDAAM